MSMKSFILLMGMCWLTPVVSSVAAPGEIDAIRVEGNRRSEPEAILAVVGSRLGEPLNRVQIRDDIKNIFRLGLYKDVQVDLSEVDGQQVLTYIVNEKASIRNIVYYGNDELSDEDLQEVVDLRAFGILNRADVNRNAEKLKDLYTEKGFFLAEIEWMVIDLPNNQVDVLFQVVENQEVKVARVNIVGNEMIDDAFIKQNLETREDGFIAGFTDGGSFRSEAFERDKLRIAQFYYNKGYVKARVGKTKVELSPDRREIYITIPVTEGERYRVGKVDITGDLIKPKEDILKLISLKENGWFSSMKLGNSINRVGELYKNAGYAYVNPVPDTRVDDENLRVSLTIDINKGKKVKVRRIEIVGNHRTRDKVIRREMRLYEGEYFSSRGLKRSEMFITRLGYFEPGGVQIRTVRGPTDDTMDIVVEVKEKPTGTFQIGAGFSSLESFMAQAQIAQNNLFGHGKTLSLQATLSSLRSTANLQYQDQYFMDSKIQFATNVYRFETNYESFINRRSGGSITIGHPLGDDWRVSSTYTLEEAEIAAGGYGDTAQTTNQLASFYSGGITSSVRLSLSYDTRNNRLFPTNGSYLTGSAEHADEFLGSENRFTRYRWRGRWYRSVGYGIVARLNTNYGLVVSPEASGVPIYERFFVGGPLTVRGFQRHTLGPELDVIQGDLPDGSTRAINIGGNEQLIFNIELEYPLLQRVGIRGVFFIDSGNSFDRYDPLGEKLESLRYSWGFGVRWFSPIGPLRFEWGFPFQPQNGEDTSVFDFSIGNFF